MAERPTKKNAPRAWQRMLSGRRLDLLDPSPFDIEIEDIAHGLARVARWNGQTIGEHAFSVAQHSVVVEEIAAHIKPGLDPKWRLAALLHDASEYVIGDMISPVKAALGAEYGEMDARLMAAVHRRFGLPATLPLPIKRQIKLADRVSARLEAVQIAGFSAAEATRLFPLPDTRMIEGLQIRLRPPAEMAMIGKALLNLDQTTSHLDPDFSPADAIRDNVSDIFASSLKVSPGGVLAAAIEAKEFTALLPKRANRILDALARGEMRVHVDAIDEQRLHLVLQRIANRLTLGIIIAATIIGAAMMMRVETDARIFGFPAIAMVFFTIAVVAALALGVQIVLTDRKLGRATVNFRLRD